MTMDNPALLSPDSDSVSILRGRREIAAFLGISVNTLMALIDTDQTFPCRQIGAVYLADKLAIRQWLGVGVTKPVSQEQIREAVKAVLKEFIA